MNAKALIASLFVSHASVVCNMAWGTAVTEHSQPVMHKAVLHIFSSAAATLGANLGIS